jgi:hypothetical protein
MATHGATTVPWGAVEARALRYTRAGMSTARMALELDCSVKTLERLESGACCDRVRPGLVERIGGMASGKSQAALLRCLEARRRQLEYRYLADEACARCGGRGIRLATQSSGLCDCAMRRAFRLCLAQWQKLNDAHESWGARAAHRATRAGLAWSFPAAEYLADFVLMIRRNTEGARRRACECYWLDGWPWSLVARRVGWEREKFFVEMRGLQLMLGRACIEDGLMPSRYLGRAEQEA